MVAALRSLVAKTIRVEQAVQVFGYRDAQRSESGTDRLGRGDGGLQISDESQGDEPMIRP